MKQFVFGLLMLLAFTSAAYAGNTSSTIDNVQDTGQSYVVNVADDDSTVTSGESASLPVDDCVRVTRNDGGIMVIDIADLTRVAAPAFGLTPADFQAQMNCCLTILVGLDGEYLTVIDPDTGQSFVFPVCK